MYSISFNGKTGKEFHLIPVRRPSVPAPEMRVEETEIPGMDGTLTEIDGTYENIVIPVEFNFLVPPDQWMDAYRKAKRWLTGTGELILGDDQEYYYKVLFCNITNTERTSRRLGNFEVEFTCFPYAFLVAGKNEYSVSEVEYNPYMTSHPTYKISGEGNCALMVNGNTFAVNVGQNAIIDTDRMITYRVDGSMMNSDVLGDYEGLYLKEGENEISITSGFNLSVIPNWRTL